jgi:hypothetical protein
MRANRIFQMSFLCASLFLTAACGGASPSSPSSSQDGSHGSSAKGATLVAKLPPAAVLAGRARFEVTSLAEDHLKGTIRIDEETVSFEASAEPNGTVRAELQDKEGTTLATRIKADGRRSLRYDGHRIAVSPAGEVRPDAFAGLSRAMRVAVGLVPIDLACAHAGGDARMMEALALPFNLLQRAEAGAIGARDLLAAATCAPRENLEATPAFSSSDVLSRSRLVVADAARRGT